MILQNIFLLLLPLAIRCDDVTNWNKFGLSDTVIPPYRNALTLLNTDILDKLININSIRGNRQLSILAHELHCTAKEICTHLQQATTANDNLKHQIDLRIDQFSDSILKLETEKKQLQSTSTLLNANIARVQENIRHAQNEVHDKQQDLNAAQNDYYKAQEALDDAHYCVRRKRRWAWFERNILEPLNTVGVALWRTGCSIVNSGGISNAEDRVSTSQNALNEANNRLTNYQNQLVVEGNNLAYIQSQLSNSNSRLVEQNRLLQQRQAEQKVAMTLAAQFRIIELHLDMVSTPSTKLIEELNMLVRFDTLINPLKNIYSELLSERLIEQDIFEVSLEKVQQVKKKLAWLEKKVFQDELQGPCVSK
jgi:chromosome segregation ATPase